MEVSLLIKAKGWLTVALDSIFFFFSAQLMSAMDGVLNDAGTIMAQLFGLMAMAVGWGMIVSDHSAPAGVEALAVVLTDAAATFLLMSATLKGVFGGLGYGLAAVYAGSAILYLYFYLLSRSAD